MAGEEFVQVQMSAAGVAFAGADGVIAIANGRSHFQFKAGAAQRVVKSYEWAFLAQQLVDGRPLFEIAPALAAATPAPDRTTTTIKPVAEEPK